MKKLIRNMAIEDITPIQETFGCWCHDLRHYIDCTDRFAWVVVGRDEITGVTAGDIMGPELNIVVTAVTAPDKETFDEIFRAMVATAKIQMRMMRCERLWARVEIMEDHEEWIAMYRRVGFLATSTVTSPNGTQCQEMLYQNSPVHAGACVIESIMLDDARVVLEGY